MKAINPENCEFYTPQFILDKVYNVFDIDVDPCSPRLDGPVIAKQHYTKNEDGLKQEWSGNVFLNPPYGSQLKYWIDKLVNEIEEGGGKVNNAIVLCPNKTDTKWYRKLEQYANFVCAIHGRLHFENDYQDGKKNVGTFASAVFIISRDAEILSKFLIEFCTVGTIYQKVILR